MMTLNPQGQKGGKRMYFPSLSANRIAEIKANKKREDQLARKALEIHNLFVMVGDLQKKVSELEKKVQRLEEKDK
jgi:hypothetical protein